jgi:hypothetical protein
MKTTRQILVAVALCVGLIGTAQAHVSVGIGIGIGGPILPVVPTVPVAVYPAPPVAYYAPPPPTPVYYSQPVWYPHYYGWHANYYSGWRGGWAY